MSLSTPQWLRIINHPGSSPENDVYLTRIGDDTYELDATLIRESDRVGQGGRLRLARLPSVTDTFTAWVVKRGYKEVIIQEFTASANDAETQRDAMLSDSLSYKMEALL